MTRLAPLLVLALTASLCSCQQKAGSEGGEQPGPSTFKPPVVDKPPASPTVDRTCTSAADCEAVACECSCSGGEGLSLREDAVLKRDAERWYQERGCQKPTTCPKVTCPPSRVDCVGGACHVVHG
ncbi:MAG: hypothetical protein QM765_42545 [Myxococcales bacterium]